MASNSLRVVYVAPFGLGQKTTVWARILPLARHLARRGHEVTLLIPPWDTPDDAGRAWTDAGVRVVNVGVAGGVPLVTWRLWRRLQAARPHVVHIVKPRAYAGIVQWLLWQRRLGNNRGARLLLDVDDWEQSWAPVAGYSWPLARLLAWQEEWGIRHADGITAASRWLADRVNSYAPSVPVLYLPNGIASVEEPTAGGGRLPAMPSTRPAVLWFSRFVEVEPEWLAAFWRGLQALWLASSGSGVDLWVAGSALSPGREQSFRAALQAATEPAYSQVTWMGFVPRGQLSALYARVDCAIFPAADLPLNQAKCSVRLANTLLAGVPVVASAVGEQAEYGGQGAAHLVPGGATPVQFAQAVAAVLAAPAQRRQLGDQARNRLLERYRWDLLGERLEMFYGQMLGGFAP